MFRVTRRAALVVLLGLAAGCGGGSPFAPVSGRVTLKGQPLAGARVAFQPADTGKLELAPGSVGTTDEDGRYTLKVVSTAGRSGALVGRHHVVISKSNLPAGPSKEETSGPGAKELVPAKYNAKSDLT